MNMKITIGMLSSLAVWLVSAQASAAEPAVADLYEVMTSGSSTQLKVGERGVVVIEIQTKPGAHVSQEAPLKIDLSSTGATLDKAQLASADSVNSSKAADTGPRFEVGFSPRAPGPLTIEGKLVFFICTEKLCARQTKLLSVPVNVK